MQRIEKERIVTGVPSIAEAMGCLIVLSTIRFDLITKNEEKEDVKEDV